MKLYNNLWFANLILALFLTLSISAQNSVIIVSAPSSAEIGSDQNVKVSYSKADATSGYVQVWLKNASNTKVKEWTKSVTNTSGSVDFSVEIPEVPMGNGYRWYAQLVNSSWKGLASVNGPTVSIGNEDSGGGTPSTSSSLRFSDAPNSVMVNNEYTVNVGFTKFGSAKAYVQLWLKDASNGTVKEWTESIGQSNGTVLFDIVVPQTPSGSGYSWYAQLVDSSWAKLTSVDGSSVTIDNVEQTPATTLANRLGVCSGSERNSGVKCYTQDGPDVRDFNQNMGDGYWSNWYVSGYPYTPNNPFRGAIKANFESGTKPWVEWENKSDDKYKHEEFDIKIQKSAWRSESGGLPAQISNIQGSINTTMSGNYSSGSIGKGHINMTAWVTKKGKEVSSDDAWASGKVDIIVHAFDNEGEFYRKYDDGPNGKYSDMGILNSSGKDYRLLRTRPGNAGELASYNLIPDDVVQSNPYGAISTSTMTSNIDMKDIIEKLIQKESNFDGVKIPINRSWSIFNLEWTVVGQSGSDNNDGSGKFIPNSKGRFTFDSYEIPDVVTSNSLKARVAVKDSVIGTSELVEFNVSPNPFVNTLEYEYSVDKNELVTVELYSLEGRVVKVVKSDEKHSVGNYTNAFDTDGLDAGIYILRMSTSDGEKTIKVVKN